MLARFGVFISMLLFWVFTGSAAHGSVWETRAQWNAENEAAYSDWISNVDENIFSSSKSPYQGIATDCAEAVYTLRIIFSFEHGLPFLIPVQNGILSNEMRRWDSISNNISRLKAF